MSDQLPFSVAQLPRFVDISCVQAFHSREDVDELLREARQSRFVSAHVLPNFRPLPNGSSYTAVVIERWRRTDPTLPRSQLRQRELVTRPPPVSPENPLDVGPLASLRSFAQVHALFNVKPLRIRCVTSLCIEL